MNNDDETENDNRSIDSGSEYEYSDDDDEISLSCYITKRAKIDYDGNDDDGKIEAQVAEEEPIVFLDEIERRLAEDAAAVWPTLTVDQKSKKSYVMAALRSPSLPPVEAFEESIPVSLRRRDRDITLAYVRRDDFEDIFTSRKAKLPKAFTNDKEIMLEVCQKYSMGLSLASEHLRRDFDVVKAAVIRDYTQVQYAAEFLQNSCLQLCSMACEQNIRAFLLFLTWKNQTVAQLDRATILRVITEIDGEHLVHAHQSIRNDPEMVLSALSNSNGSVQTCMILVPVSLLGDIQFIRSAIATKANVYMLDLSTEALKNRELALAAVEGSSYYSVVDRVIEYIPDLFENGQLASAVLARTENERFRPVEIRNDRTRMTQGIIDVSTRMIFLGNWLQNKVFLMEWLSSAPLNSLRAFLYLRAEWKKDKEISSFVIRRLPCDQAVVDSAATSCPASLKDREVLLAYLSGVATSNSQPTLKDPFASILLDAIHMHLNDEEIVAALDGFCCLARSSDLSFVRRATAVNCCFYSCAKVSEHESAIHFRLYDMEIICILCAKLNNDERSLDMLHHKRDLEFILKNVQCFVDNSEKFEKNLAVLRGPGAPETIRKVAALEAEIGAIGSFVEIPFGDHLQTLRDALKILPQTIKEAKSRQK